MWHAIFRLTPESGWERKEEINYAPDSGRDNSRKEERNAKKPCGERDSLTIGS